MTSAELAARLSDVPPALENVNEFRNALFGEMGAPQIMTMSHAHPTSINRDGDFATAQAQNLRLGDWIFSQFNILAISTQPGSYAGHENPTLGGNYYNSIVVGKKSYNYTYPAQSSVDNSNGPRNKPDIVVAASSLAEASSWSAPTLAAAASGFLGPGILRPAPRWRHLHADHESHHPGRCGQKLPLPRILNRNRGLLQRPAFPVRAMAMDEFGNRPAGPQLRRRFVQLSQFLPDPYRRTFHRQRPIPQRRLGLPGDC